MPRRRPDRKTRASAKRVIRRAQEDGIRRADARREPGREVPDITILGRACPPSHHLTTQGARAEFVVDHRPPPPPKEISTAAFRTVLNDGYRRRQGF